MKRFKILEKQLIIQLLFQLFSVGFNSVLFVIIKSDITFIIYYLSGMNTLIFNELIKKRLKKEKEEYTEQGFNLINRIINISDLTTILITIIISLKYYLVLLFFL